MSGPDFRHMPIAGLTRARLAVLIAGQRDQVAHTCKTCMSAVKRKCLSHGRAAEIISTAEAVLDLLMALEQEFPSHV